MQKAQQPTEGNSPFNNNFAVGGAEYPSLDSAFAFLWHGSGLINDSPSRSKAGIPLNPLFRITKRRIIWNIFVLIVCYHTKPHKCLMTRQCGETTDGGWVSARWSPKLLFSNLDPRVKSCRAVWSWTLPPPLPPVNGMVWHFVRVGGRPAAGWKVGTWAGVSETRCREDVQKWGKQSRKSPLKCSEQNGPSSWKEGKAGSRRGTLVRVDPCKSL